MANPRRLKPKVLVTGSYYRCVVQFRYKNDIGPHKWIERRDGVDRMGVYRWKEIDCFDASLLREATNDLLRAFARRLRRRKKKAAAPNAPAPKTDAESE